MTRTLIIDPDGQVVGRVIEETIEATTEPLKALLAYYAKEGAPMMIGGHDEERGISWDGFEFIAADDPRFFETVIEALSRKGYQFREGPLEEPSPLAPQVRGP